MPGSEMLIQTIDKYVLLKPKQQTKDRWVRGELSKYSVSE